MCWLLPCYEPRVRTCATHAVWSLVLNEGWAFVASCSLRKSLNEQKKLAAQAAAAAAAANAEEGPAGDVNTLNPMKVIDCASAVLTPHAPCLFVCFTSSQFPATAIIKYTHRHTQTQIHTHAHTHIRKLPPPT